MMRLLLLLVACVSVGLSYGADVLHYGDTYRIDLREEVYSLEYRSKYTSEPTVLWKRYEPQANVDNRRRVIGYYYVISNVTQEDNGLYTVRREYQFRPPVHTLEVKASTESYYRETGQELRFSFKLERDSCNIYFFPDEGSWTVIVRSGRLQQSYTDCTGFKLLKPCGILIDYLQEACSGRFEIRDHKENKALVVSLEVESDAIEPSTYFVGGSILLSILGTFCVTCCCRKKKSSDKDRSEAAADGDNNENEPAVHYQEYNHEPVGQRQNQPHVSSGMSYPTQPSFTPTAPLIHNPPTDMMPPAYSEVVGSSGPADAPTVILYSDSEPRFEVKTMNFNSADPLSSDPPQTDVYNSDKLNFL